MSALNGYKTYLLAAAAVIYAIAGFATGNLDANAAIQVAMAAFGAMFLRHGIANTPTA